MIDWTDLLATMLGDLADEWPAETAADGRTVLLPRATEATRMDALLDLWGYTEAGAA